MGENRWSPRSGVEVGLAVLIFGCPLGCIVAGLVEGLGPGVLIVVAVLAAGVGWLKWREVRAGRAERRAVDAVYELYTDALDRAERGDLTGAVERFEEALAAPGGDDYTTELMQGLAAAHLAQGAPGRAVAVWRRAYQLHRDEQGDDAVSTLAAANGLAAALLIHGERAAAGERYRDTLDRCRRLLGDAHPETVAALNGAARTASQPEPPQPQSPHEQAAELYERLFGPSHPDTRIARQAAPQDPATARLAAGDLAGARTLCEQAAGTPAGCNDLAMVLREQRDLTAAYRAYERAAELSDPLDPEHLAARNGIVRVMLLQGDETNAATELTAVVEACVARFGEQHPETAAARRNLDRLSGGSS
ncbi:tetratricopeptide repeat protein [Dactylosporangium sp. NPDC049525]|uniref:tetratricopeptide repeat protein n=1 Tax=Dactylosporangium sp. NPDC049525 TaxID=3154730 RepID=UPI00343B8059